MNKGVFILFFLGVVIISACNIGAEGKSYTHSDNIEVEPKKNEVLVEKAVEPVQNDKVEPEATATKADIKNAKPETEEKKPEEEGPRKPKIKKLAEIEFKEQSYDFGEIEEGDKITHSFEFKNTGNAPLTINDVSVSCGCTVPSYPIMPIGPGESGTIGVVFDSKGKFGSQRPFVTVKSNTKDKLTKLFLTGSIKHVFENTAPKDTTNNSKNSNH